MKKGIQKKKNYYEKEIRPKDKIEKEIKFGNRKRKN